jgi:hypothetical protein
MIRRKRRTAAAASSRSRTARPFVIGAEKGFFKKYGLNVTVAKGANWAAIRDSLSNGDNQFTHMLLGMPFASTMGLLGSPKKPMVIPWLVNRNGQAITLKTEFKGKVQADAKALKPFVEKAKGLGEPLSFAMTFPPGTHAMWTRYWLASGGIHPDKDISLITIPPPQMIANMKVGKMDGFCVGEPWNARAISDQIGYTAITTQMMWKDHPGEGLRLHEGVRGEEPEDGEGRAQGPERARACGSTRSGTGRSNARSSASRITSTARRRSSSAGCSATTTWATGGSSRTSSR